MLESAATAADLEALLGVALSPAELMDVLVGMAPPGPARLPGPLGRDAARAASRRCSRTATRLVATVDDAEAGVELPEAAFDAPPHAGYRPIDAAEARRLLGGR